MWSDHRNGRFLCAIEELKSERNKEYRAVREEIVLNQVLTLSLLWHYSQFSSRRNERETIESTDDGQVHLTTNERKLVD